MKQRAPVTLNITWAQHQALSNLLCTARSWAYVEGRKDLAAVLTENKLELLHAVRQYERAFDLPEREE